jgi:hypothetical protein
LVPAASAAQSAGNISPPYFLFCAAVGKSKQHRVQARQVHAVHLPANVEVARLFFGGGDASVYVSSPAARRA